MYETVPSFDERKKETKCTKFATYGKDRREKRRRRKDQIKKIERDEGDGRKKKIKIKSDKARTD